MGMYGAPLCTCGAEGLPAGALVVSARGGLLMWVKYACCIRCAAPGAEAGNPATARSCRDVPNAKWAPAAVDGAGGRSCCSTASACARAAAKAAASPCDSERLRTPHEGSDERLRRRELLRRRCERVQRAGRGRGGGRQELELLLQSSERLRRRELLRRQRERVQRAGRGPGAGRQELELLLQSSEPLRRRELLRRRRERVQRTDRGRVGRGQVLELLLQSSERMRTPRKGGSPSLWRRELLLLRRTRVQRAGRGRGGGRKELELLLQSDERLRRRELLRRWCERAARRPRPSGPGAGAGVAAAERRVPADPPRRQWPAPVTPRAAEAPPQTPAARRPRPSGRAAGGGVVAAERRAPAPDPPRKQRPAAE
jgi:hypothetical protein